MATHRTAHPAARPAFRPTAAAVALLFATLGTHAHAQTPAETTTATLPAVVVNDRQAAATADVTGFADEPLARSPVSATVVNAQTIQDSGARRLSDLYKLDASVSDAYNAGGYYDYASVRGFVIDNNFNFRREGLPINAETALPLDHLERVELLKGTSGIQAGTSAPGGLFNSVVKRPTQQPLRQLRTEFTDAGSALLHLDMGGRLGADGALGYRLNLAGERLNTHTPGTEGLRTLAALALEARLSPHQLLEGEFEISRRRQPTVPGLSLLGDALPPADPRINLNTQPWSQPTVFRNFSGSLRYTHTLDSQWNWQAQLGTQRLKADDHLAYPFGCYDAGSGTYYADRYCPNGDVDLYDYRSENERRNTTATQWRLNGKFSTGALQHQLTAGVLASRFRHTGNPQADNNAAAGTGNLFTLPAVAPLPNYTDPYTNQRQRSTEWFATDVIRWNEQLQTWLGLRHTRIERHSVRTDGSRATGYSQNVTTPWLAATWQFDPVHMAYASWGQGVESEVAPGRARYTNQGEALPALKSRQWEVGFKGSTADRQWHATLFHITRPASADQLNGGATECSATGSCTRVIDGDALHRGIELGASQQWRHWSLGGSATWLHAQRRGSVIDPSINGQRPTNVPRFVLRANLGHRLASLPGLTLNAHLSHEGQRAILPDGSLQLPAWTRVDVAAHYDTQLQGHDVRWTLGIDNLADRRYFKESPYQYGHIYLFPGAARTVRLALETKF